MVEGRRWVWRCTTPPTVHRLAVTRALCFVATLGCVDAEDAGDENAELHGNHYKDEKPLLRAAHCKKKKPFFSYTPEPVLNYNFNKLRSKLSTNCIVSIYNFLEEDDRGSGGHNDRQRCADNLTVAIFPGVNVH